MIRNLTFPSFIIWKRNRSKQSPLNFTLQLFVEAAEKVGRNLYNRVEASRSVLNRTGLI